MPKGYKCYCCGATGEEAFANTREDLLGEIDDDYFDYEKPLDFVTAAERKKLMKDAGGDETKANAMLTQGNAAETAAGGTAEETDVGDVDAPKKKKKKKKKKAKKENEGDVDASADADVSAKSKSAPAAAAAAAAAESDDSSKVDDTKGKGDMDVLDMD